MSGPSRWWYGVAPFPLVVCAALLARFATRRFVAVSSAGGDPNVAAGIASFALSVLAQWTGVFLALVVLVALVLDVRALRRGERWTPSRAWTLAGVAHLLGAVLAPVLVVSVPSLSYYLYRRHERVGSP